MQLQPNTSLQSGKYRIIRVLGQGGFGITYLAENTYFEKNVAIKEFFPKDFCARNNTSHLTLGTRNNTETVAKLKARFLKEAKNISKLDHPGIVRILDIFEENNTAYYVMDYIEGDNLNEIVKQKGPLSEEKAVEYIKKVGEALVYIHSRNMTHFDVKPANIVIRKSDDMPILIDFGLSKQYTSKGDATSTLLQGVSRGYSPIELYNPGSIANFSPQTDVYSLGATFYYLLTSRTPISAPDIIENGIILPNYISDSSSSAIRSAMSVSRPQRTQNIASFIEQIVSRDQTHILTKKKSSNPIGQSGIINSKSKHTKESKFRSTRLYKKKSPNTKDYKIILSVCMAPILIGIVAAIISYGSTNKESNTSTETFNHNIYDVYDKIDSLETVMPQTEEAVVVIPIVKDMFWNSPLGIASYTGEIVFSDDNEGQIPHGKGIAKISEGQYKGCVYEGNFVYGKMDGEALYTQPNGDVFQGTFKNNKYEKGRYTIKSTGEYFEGTFDNNGEPFYGEWYDQNGNKL